MSYLIIGSDYASLPYVIDVDGTEEDALKRVAEEDKAPKLAGYRPFFLVNLDDKTVQRILRVGYEGENDWRLADEARTIVGIATPDDYFEEKSQ